MAHYTKPDGRLLRDRLCASCAGGQHAGEACASCRLNTWRLRSGDVLIFHGRDAFHGLSAVEGVAAVEDEHVAAPSRTVLRLQLAHASPACCPPAHDAQSRSRSSLPSGLV